MDKLLPTIEINLQSVVIQWNASLMNRQLHLLYLHGFLSGPSSEKAQQTCDYFSRYHPDIELHCPQLPFDFDQWPAVTESLIARFAGQKVGIIGSSLGGFLATYLSAKLNCPAVAINPAVRPDELLEDYLGLHQCYYANQEVEVCRRHLPMLRAMRLQSPPNSMRVFLQTDDETLDYRQAASFYLPHQLVVEQGGDHSFQNYSRHLPAIHKYLFPVEK